MFFFVLIDENPKENRLRRCAVRFYIFGNCYTYTKKKKKICIYKHTKIVFFKKKKNLLVFSTNSKLRNKSITYTSN